jgi:hypothetical protein
MKENQFRKNRLTYNFLLTEPGQTAATMKISVMPILPVTILLPGCVLNNLVEAAADKGAINYAAGTAQDKRNAGGAGNSIADINVYGHSRVNGALDFNGSCLFKDHRSRFSGAIRAEIKIHDIRD